MAARKPRGVSQTPIDILQTSNGLKRPSLTMHIDKSLGTTVAECTGSVGNLNVYLPLSEALCLITSVRKLNVTEHVAL